MQSSPFDLGTGWDWLLHPISGWASCWQSLWGAHSGHQGLSWDHQSRCPGSGISNMESPMGPWTLTRARRAEKDNPQVQGSWRQHICPTGAWVTDRLPTVPEMPSSALGLPALSQLLAAGCARGMLSLAPRRAGMGGRSVRSSGFHCATSKVRIRQNEPNQTFPARPHWFCGERRPGKR